MLKMFSPLFKFYLHKFVICVKVTTPISIDRFDIIKLKIHFTQVSMFYYVYWIFVLCAHRSNSRLATYAIGQIDRCLSWKVGICQWIFIFSIVFEVQQFYLCYILITRFSTWNVVLFWGLLMVLKWMWENTTSAIMSLQIWLGFNILQIWLIWTNQILLSILGVCAWC